MDAALQHLGDARHAGGELHVGNGAVRHARSGLCEKVELRVCKVDAVREPDVRADPAERLEIGEGTQAVAVKRVALLVLRLGKVCVQADMILPRQLRTLQQQLARTLP